MTEQWKPVYGLESRYQISDHGRVWSNRGTGKLRTIQTDKCGYKRADLFLNYEYWRKYVHTMVLEAFVEPRPEGLQCRHLDGDPSNNRLENLAWGTSRENGQDRSRHHAERAKNGVKKVTRKRGTRKRVTPRVLQTHCRRGHLFDEENTHKYGEKRVCRQCRRDRKRVYRAEARALTLAASDQIASLEEIA